MEPTPSAEPRAPDAYEAAHMKPDGQILHREKIIAPRIFNYFFAAPAALSFAVTAPLSLFTGEWAPLLASAGVSLCLLAIWSLFVTIRVTVSTKEVLVQYGTFGPSIPLEAISSCESVSYDWRSFGGWGIKRSSDGTTAYNMPGDEGRGVKITWTDPKGKTHKTLIGTKNALTLANAINSAKSRAQVRIDPAEVEQQAEVVGVGVGGRSGGAPSR